jgi:hypothetical protein
MERLTSAELWRILFFIIGGGLFFLSTWVGTQALFPKFTRQAQDAFSRPWLNFLVGLLVLAGMAAVSAIFAAAGPVAQLVGGTLGVTFLTLALAGSAGLARKIGSGMIHPTDKEQPWRRTLRGGVVLLGPLLIPLVNLPPLLFVLLTGAGASIRTLWKARAERKAAGTNTSTLDD